MGMTRAQALALSPSAVRQIQQDKTTHANLDHHDQSPGAKSQPPLCHESLAAEQIESGGSTGDGRIQVCVTSFRRRLLDEDNLCPKFHVDALRYAGLLPTDAPQAVTIQTRQEKVASAADERTEITLILPDPAALALSKTD